MRLRWFQLLATLCVLASGCTVPVSPEAGDPPLLSRLDAALRGEVVSIVPTNGPPLRNVRLISLQPDMVRVVSFDETVLVPTALVREIRIAGRRGHPPGTVNPAVGASAG